MFGYVTEEQFKVFKKHWEEVELKGLDSDIFETCKMLASTEELIPVLYTSGYSDVKEKLKLKNTKVTNKSAFSRYIVLGVKPGHTKLFVRFDQWRANLHYDDWQKIKPTLSTGMLNGGSIDVSLDRTHFNYWMLEFRYKLCNNNQNRHLLMDPPWMDTLWLDMIKCITR